MGCHGEPRIIGFIAAKQYVNEVLFHINAFVPNKTYVIPTHRGSTELTMTPLA
ncbi:MAG: hypothetical protein JWR02_491 [Mucilaginibacter sp.]|nr:hypothetical protein [Mucilaginibacter sp.]